MGFVLNILVTVAALIVAVFVFWRLLSRRRSLPCPVWLRRMVEMDNPFSRATRADFIIGKLEIRPGMTVLDAGCGPGRVTIPAARAVGADGVVTAADIQAGMLARVREKAAAEGLDNIRFVNAGLGDGKLGQNEFDRAVLVMVLGEIVNREAAVRELFDALKPGGVLSVSESVFDPHFLRRKTVLELAGGAGFKEKAVFGNRFSYTMHLEKP